MKKVLLIVASAALFFCSCQKEMELPQEKAQNPYAFKASIEELSTPTKATINSSHQFIWSAGDKIGIYTNNDWGTKNQPFTIDGEGGSSTGNFVWDYDSGNFTVTTANVAFFPWKKIGDDIINRVESGKVKLTLDDSYYGYTSGMMLTPLVASISRTGDAYDPIEFKHAGAAVKVTINNLPAGSHSIGMSIKNQQITGEFEITPPTSTELEAMTVVGTPDNTKNTFWLNFDPSDAARSFTFVFPVPALTAPKPHFQIWDENNILVWETKLKAQPDLGRGDILVMPETEITPYKQFNATSTEWTVWATLDGTNWQDIDMITDGSLCIAKGVVFTADGAFKVHKDMAWSVSYPTSNKDVTAGTYDIIFDPSGSDDAAKVRVVPSKCPYPKATHWSKITGATDLGATETANCYVIKAPGSYKIPCVKGNSNESAGTRASVSLLWETYNNGEDVTPNSVIAAVDYDVRDNYVYFKTPDTLKPGNALIAARDADGNIIWSWHIWIPQTDYTSSTYGNIYNHELMDRNLGALVAASTTSVPVESYGLHYQWGRKDPFLGAKNVTSSSQATVSGVAMSVATDHMTVAETIANPTVYAIYSTSSTWGPWLNPVADSPTLWKNGVKTIYDPCPAGYRVPGRDTSQPLHSSDLSGVTGWSDNGTDRYFTLGDPAAVFPYCGYIQENGVIGYVGSRSFIWMSGVDSDNAGYMMNVRTGDAHGRTSTVTSRGCTVRCVKIEGAPVPQAGASSITLNGNMDDWASAGAITGGGGIKEWKYGSDGSNLYFYFKIKVSSMKAESDGTYRTRRYIYIAMNTDNKTSTGAESLGYGSLTMSGCDALALVYPFKGTLPTGENVPTGLEFVAGLDDMSWTRTYPKGSKTAEGNITTYGYLSGDYIYLEVGIPRTAIGSPAAGNIQVEFSLSSDLSGPAVIPICAPSL